MYQTCACARLMQNIDAYGMNVIKMLLINKSIALRNKHKCMDIAEISRFIIKLYVI